MYTKGLLLIYKVIKPLIKDLRTGGIHRVIKFIIFFKYKHHEIKLGIRLSMDYYIFDFK